MFWMLVSILFSTEDDFINMIVMYNWSMKVDMFVEIIEDPASIGDKYIEFETRMPKVKRKFLQEIAI